MLGRGHPSFHAARGDHRLPVSACERQCLAACIRVLNARRQGRRRRARPAVGREHGDARVHRDPDHSFIARLEAHLVRGSASRRRVADGCSSFFACECADDVPIGRSRVVDVFIGRLRVVDVASRVTTTGTDGHCGRCDCRSKRQANDGRGRAHAGTQSNERATFGWHCFGRDSRNRPRAHGRPERRPAASRSRLAQRGTMAGCWFDSAAATGPGRAFARGQTAPLPHWPLGRALAHPVMLSKRVR